MENEEKNLIEQLELNEEEQKGVEKFLEAVDFKAQDYREVDQALTKKFYIPLESKKKNLEQKKVLFNILQEFFSCFMVIGYDLEGNDMFYHFAPNPLTHTALEKRFQEIGQQKAIQESGLLQLLSPDDESELEDYEDDED